MTRIIFAVSAIALMGLPMAAHAQSASSTVTISGEVEQACTLGAPAAAELHLGDIPGAAGRLAPGLAQSTTIAVAWCNTPSEMTLAAEPLSLVTPPGYTTPTGFSRLITYDATVGGWAEALAHRPLVGDLSNSVTASTPWAADPLQPGHAECGRQRRGPDSLRRGRRIHRDRHHLSGHPVSAGSSPVMVLSSPTSRSLGFLIGALGIAMPAAAQEVSTVTVVGSAEDQCVLGQPELGTGPVENFNSPSGAVFVVSQLTDPVTLTTRGAQLSLELEAMCNGPHRLTVASENAGLWRTGVSIGASGFGSAVPYRVQLGWAAENRNLIAEAASRQAVDGELLVGRPNAGDVLLDFIIDAGATNAGTGAPLLSGTYSDVLTVTVDSQ